MRQRGVRGRGRPDVPVRSEARIRGLLLTVLFGFCGVARAEYPAGIWNVPSTYATSLSDAPGANKQPVTLTFYVLPTGSFYGII
jgi:hypothetical protein